jgi:hypothetical protein
MTMSDALSPVEGRVAAEALAMATVPTDMMVIAERIPAMILVLILLVFIRMISPFRFDFVFPLLWLYSITLTFATSLQISVKKFISISRVVK